MMVPQPWGRGQRWPPRAPPSPEVSLTVGVTDHVGLRVRLPQDAVAPRGDIDPHLKMGKAAGISAPSGLAPPSPEKQPSTPKSELPPARPPFGEGTGWQRCGG